MFKLKGIQIPIQFQGNLGRALKSKIFKKGNILEVSMHKFGKVQAQSVLKVIDIVAVNFTFQLKRGITISTAPIF